MARHAVVDLCGVLSLEPTEARADRLPAAEEKELEGLLAKAALRLRTDHASIAQLHALRASYEPYVDALSSFLLMPLPDWVPPVRESEFSVESEFWVAGRAPRHDRRLELVPNHD
ncbi:MAG: hypothetical protein E6J87_25455 [Deltaproteobacteria bacterium]|nr:MAG: hypothetical protein E6J87_25455 [Deltaproteobacteria bacterium]